MIEDGGATIELLGDGRTVLLDGKRYVRVGTPAWRVLDALEEDWPLPLPSRELYEAVGLKKLDDLPRFVNYARAGFAALGIAVVFRHGAGYEVVGAEDVRCSDRLPPDEDEWTEIVHAEVREGACADHLDDLIRAHGDPPGDVEE